MNPSRLMTTIRTLAIALVLLPASLAVAAPPQPPLVFRIGFWNNLHEFLYVLGRAQNHASDAERDAVANAPAELNALSQRPGAERATWQSAVDFYATGPSKMDAVFDKDLVKATAAIAAASDSSNLSGLGLDPALVATLQRAAPIYRAVWWTAHRRADRMRRDDLVPLVARFGAPLVSRLTAVYQAEWPVQPRVVNLAAYTNWAGAYSTDGGLIEFSSTDPAIGGTLGLEILFHESSHQWDDEMNRRLNAVAESHHARVPEGLSHAIVFYTSGDLVKALVPDHVPYAEKFGLWNHSSLRAFKPVLDEYWRPYVRGDGTIDGAIAHVIAHLQ
jgi:hypothetical protein